MVKHSRLFCGNSWSGGDNGGLGKEVAVPFVLVNLKQWPLKSPTTLCFGNGFMVDPNF